MRWHPLVVIGRNILMETDISLPKSPSTILDRKIDNLVDYFITSSMGEAIIFIVTYCVFKL